MRTLLSLLLMASPLVASAHGGHGSTSATTVLHWIIEPIHAAPLGLALIVGVLAVRTVIKKRKNESV